MGPTGSDPVDTCPGRTAAGPGFDSWGGGPGDVSCPAFSWAEAGGAGRFSPLPLCSTPPLFKAKLSAALFLFDPAPALWRLKVKPDALGRVLEKAQRDEPSRL